MAMLFNMNAVYDIYNNLFIFDVIQFKLCFCVFNRFSISEIFWGSKVKFENSKPFSRGSLRIKIELKLKWKHVDEDVNHLYTSEECFGSCFHSRRHYPILAQVFFIQRIFKSV